MNREEFMRQLERLLQDISESERREALEYYNSYFDDAGEENESRVIQELGSPGKVAAIIKADLEENSREYGEYTENGYEDPRTREESQVPDRYGQTERARRGYRTGGRNNKGTIILLVILAVFAAPILLGIGGGIFGILVGILGGIAGIVVGLAGGMVGALAGGVGVLIAGIVECFSSPALGFVGIGIGFLLLAVGILLLVLFGWLFIRVFPWMIRKISDLVHKAAHRAKGQDKGGEQI
ncbi:MAG TPA: hypothetical protein IAA45_11000 [Candidatus Blautia gallistercoris]|uniref:DUF1700 domain-containing protein n=1 Tax=Candidatus Blautia gallistercoris TaxID=2838490 RepID=A0A9D1WJS1_9FIRM|nr:hypothetical protein [Candidatus Blautia gallistercoris]